MGISKRTIEDIKKGKGTKDDKGKIDLTLNDPYFDEETSKVMMNGAGKYKRGNWQLDLEPVRILAALERHVLQLKKNKFIDRHSGLRHTAHIRCNAMFLDYYIRHGLKKITEHDKG